LRSPAYSSKPWFSREFLASTLAKPPGSWHNPKGTRLLLPADYKDRYFTIRDGVRATVGFDADGLPPGRRPRRLFVLGGSTTYCMEVPDAFTFASQLQQRLAAIPETRDIEVVNCGVPAAVSLQEVERLEYEIGRNNIPDFCIFFDGLNDVFQGVFNGGPGNTISNELRVYTNKGLLFYLKRVAGVSVAARTIYHSIVDAQGRNDPLARPEAAVRELAVTTADVYEQNLLRAKSICDRYRIRMFVYLQPTLYTIDRPLTPHEQATAAREGRIKAETIRKTYPLLRAKLELLSQRGIMAYDVSDLFGANSEPIFVDQYHVESTGNALIAAAILKRALPILRDSSWSGDVALPPGPKRRTERPGDSASSSCVALGAGEAS
jgi:hypothetical protein